MVFDHMFAIIDNLSFSKKEENSTGTKLKSKFNYPSLDTAFLVAITLIAIFIYAFYIIKQRRKKHYRKKYTGVELQDIRACAPLAPIRQIY